MEAVMSCEARQEYLRAQRTRYRRASRAQKGRILDEVCELLGMHRKSLVRIFGRRPTRKAKRRGPKPRYGAEVLAPLKVIWRTAQQPCSKRLRVVVAAWLPYYERHYGAVDEEVREGLLSVSAATIDRLMAPVRARARRGLSATSATNRLKGQIPIRTRFQDVEGPGYFEADTVAHCGTSLSGSFVWSLTLTDIWSGWTENAAVWTKDARAIVDRVREIEEGLAFELEGFDSDNGGEFINHHLHRYLRNRPIPVDFTRSRPYHKNDNAHVEQKQWTHVRQLLGYDRLEDRRLVAMIHDLYRHEWRALQNFFLPTMQLIAKFRDGGRVRRRHSQPRTPYERLMASPGVSRAGKEQLRREFESLDPFVLNKAIETKLRAIFRMVRRQTPGASARQDAPPPERAVEMPPCDQPVPALAPLASRTACSQGLENSPRKAPIANPKALGGEFPTVPQPRRMLVSQERQEGKPR